MPRVSDQMPRQSRDQDQQRTSGVAAAELSDVRRGQLDVAPKRKQLPFCTQLL
jgi:hypothetical protein